MIIYLSGPISGQTPAAVTKRLSESTHNLRNIGYSVFHPQSGNDTLWTTVQPTGREAHRIFKRDRWMVERADIVLADLRCAKRVSIGTVFEIAWASDTGKHVVLILERGSHPHDHSFVYEAADVVFYNEEDALTYLRSLTESL